MKIETKINRILKGYIEKQENWRTKSKEQMIKELLDLIAQEKEEYLDKFVDEFLFSPKYFSQRNNVGSWLEKKKPVFVT